MIIHSDRALGNDSGVINSQWKGHSHPSGESADTSLDVQRGDKLAG